MRSSFRILTVLLLAVASAFEVAALPGDTTWVTVFNLKKLDHHGNYDTTVTFPQGNRYRKIRMHYILGRYACPGNPQYCGSWDYTTQIYSLPAGKDSVEIGRVITPYATDWLQKNKSHDYILDVTDYESVLEGSSHIRFRYDGYSWGFSLTLKFELIEGVPPMDAVSVENIYDGYFAYGNASNPIENHLIPTALTYTTAKAAIKNSISGHGADATGCSEFCSKYYQLMLNGTSVATKQIWRNDCGYNEVYPQTGTWVFDRSNWCPGAVVWPIYHDLEGLTTSSTTFTADVDMEPYTISNPSGGYNFVSQLISYSAFNHAVDASIEDLIAPSQDANFFRDNPACRNPVVRIKNTGSDPLLTVAFEYGLSGRALSTYTWSGLLNPLETVDVTFPPSPSIMAHSVAAQFEVKIVDVNASPNDQNNYNNYYYGKTKPVTIVPDSFIVQLGTNKSAFGGVSETSWKLYDENDNLVKQRVNASVNTIYQDTLRNLTPGCYKLVVNDAGCDGYDWWYYQYYSVNPGIGSLRMDRIGQSNPLFLFAGDFGCGFTKYFHVGQYPPPPPPPNLVGAEELRQETLIEVFPNPAHDNVLVKIVLPFTTNASVKLTDIHGRTLHGAQLGEVNTTYYDMDCGQLSSGIYFVTVSAGPGVSFVKKLVIQ